jgi:hypothetical protein
MRDEPYVNAAAFRRGANARMREVAKQQGRPIAEVNREFVLQRFLARIFREPDSPWVLKGGTGLLVRLLQARHSDDIDLLYPTDTINLALPLADLEAALQQPYVGDFLRFEIGRVEARSVTSAEKAVATVRVAALFGAAEYTRFPIDLSVKKRPLAKVDLVQPQPVVDVPGVPKLPVFALYPLADQIADKVCAMYELHRDGIASTRYHDLVDLVLIVTGSSTIDAAATCGALNAEARHRRLRLPVAMVSPGDQWAPGYQAEARRTGLASELHQLHFALSVVDSCLGPLLRGSVPTGRWDPASRRWDAE